MFVKICGVTRPIDAEAAVAAGADAVGIVLAPTSRRRVDRMAALSIRSAVPTQVKLVGVFVDSPNDEILRLRDEIGFDVAQLHGDESLEDARKLAQQVRVIRVCRSKAEATADGASFPGLFARLFDAPTAGAGLPWDWSLAASAPRDRPVIVAGGLSPRNVQAAIAAAHPDGVDVASGVESSPGIKNLQLMRAFVTAAKETE